MLSRTPLCTLKLIGMGQVTRRHIAPCQSRIYCKAHSILLRCLTGKLVRPIRRQRLRYLTRLTSLSFRSLTPLRAMAQIQTVQGKIVCKIWLLDNSYKTVLVEPTSTVQDVCLMMAEKLAFIDPMDDSLCFSLHECQDEVTIERALKGDREVLPIMEAWTAEEARFVFQCKLFTETLVGTEDPEIIRLLFIQNVYHIITGTYPCNKADAIQLASLQVQAKFGKHNPATHKVGFLTSSLHEYVPAPFMAEDDMDTAAWEEQIFQKHAISMTESPMESYLAVVSRRDYYGSVLFGVKQRYDKEMPKKLFLGVARQGILLLRIPNTFTDSDGMETLAQYPLADIYRWAYKPGVNFYFELKLEDADENPVFTFETQEGQHMSDLLTDYALALLREMGLNADGSKREKKVAAKLKDSAAFSNESAYDSVDGDAGALAKSAARAAQWEAEDAEADEVDDDGAAAAAGGDGEEDVPAPWSKEWDPNHETYYYFNNDTGESSWEVPT